MRILTIMLGAAALSAGVDAAHAHPGHLAENGHGHSHWLALFILGGLGGLAVGALAFRLVKGRLPLVDADTTNK